MQRGWCILIFISVIYFTTTVAFDSEFFRFMKCPSDCSAYACIKKKILRTTCKGGTVYDICGCCQRCAKLEGEACGGYGEFKDAYGKCDVGFFCHVKPKSRKAKKKYGIGKCKVLPKEPKQQPLQIQRDNKVWLCRHECTAEFCSKWPDAICSAANNKIVERACQYPCQHTVCSACYFEPKEDPPCRKCDKDDYNCFRKFAKCVKKDYCTRMKYPCHPHARRKSDGDFKCKVAACLSND